MLPKTKQLTFLRGVACTNLYYHPFKSCVCVTEGFGRAPEGPPIKHAEELCFGLSAGRAQNVPRSHFPPYLHKLLQG